MANNIDAMFEALADPTRRRAVELLRKRRYSSGELATRTGASPSLMSRHLRVLFKSGLVGEERDDNDARRRILYLRREPFTDLQRWLDQMQALWTDQLGAFKRHAEVSGSRRER